MSIPCLQDLERNKKQLRKLKTPLTLVLKRENVLPLRVPLRKLSPNSLSFRVNTMMEISWNQSTEYNLPVDKVLQNIILKQSSSVTSNQAAS